MRVLRRGRGGQVDGNHDADTGAFAGAGFHFKFPAMSFDDAPDDGQAQARAFGFGAAQDG